MIDDDDSAGVCTRVWRVSTSDQDHQRGQIDARLILGVLALILVAGPLATTAVDIQSSLAATPAFSWVSAGAIALLFVAIIVAGLLGVE
jgi:hypothetical protein